MSVRKIAGLFAGFALAVGLIGGGVSAAFTSTVSAVQNISVGTFGCAITSPGLTAVGNTVTFNAPTITSSDAGTSPFIFTVTSTGTIPAVLTVSATVPAAPFTDMLGAQPAVKLATLGAAHTYNAGLQWPELGMANLGQAVSITYTASCNEDHSSVTFSSVLDPGNAAWVDNTINGSGWTPGAMTTFVVQYGASTPFDLIADFGEVINADALGNIVFSGGPGYIGANTWQDNCQDGPPSNAVQHGTQVVHITATQGALTATGTGSAPCP